MAQTVVLDWNAFFEGEIKEKQIDQVVLHGGGVGIIFGPFAPIVEQLDKVVTPLAYVMLVIAALAAMTGNHSTAIERFKWASIGYLGFNYIPKWLALLQAAS